MLAFSPIPMFDRMDHPSVPTTFPWRTAVDGGQGWPQGHREAASSVLEGHPPPCDAGDRRALGHTSASHDPYRHREAELGSPSKSGTAIPSIIVLLLNARPPNLEEARQTLGRLVKNAERAGDVIGRI